MDPVGYLSGSYVFRQLRLRTLQSRIVLAAGGAFVGIAMETKGATVGSRWVGQPVGWIDVAEIFSQGHLGA